MAYKRKTYDEWEIQGNYGYGYECVTTEEKASEAKKRIKEYRENEPGTSFRIQKKRVKIESQA